MAGFFMIEVINKKVLNLRASRIAIGTESNNRNRPKVEVPAFAGRQV